ncbi:MAG: ABC transporter ATP-binding protein [Clostridium sp.]|nr:ABC transporter ATP-binding protein [Clostridium sp.]
MVRVEHVTKVYNKGKANEFLALQDVSFTVEDGEMVAIIGKSGAGKSTLLHILACVDTYEDGEYYLDDKLVKNQNDRENAKVRNQHLGVVMQDYALVEDFTALENVMLPLDFSKVRIKNKKERALEMLDKVDMKEFADKQVSDLSGGQKQRVAIARAIANDPQMILADEPTGALDSKNTEQIMDILKGLNQQGRTVIVVTHDPLVSAKCKRVIELVDGKII